MLVRKLKCPSCGSSKVAEVKTGHVFCDYCAEFMGFDFVKLEDESKALFNMDYYLEHGGWPEATRNYLSVVTQMGEAIKNKDAEKYVELAVKQMDMQMTLMPGVFSPKVKVEGYRRKYLIYYRAFLEDRIADHFFEEQEQFNAMIVPMSQKITMKMVDGGYIWNYDEQARAYFKVVYDFSVALSEKVVAYPSASLYPDQISEYSKELFLKQSMAGYCKMLTEPDFLALTREYGFENQYIEVPEIKTSEIKCSCCSSVITVLEGAKLVLCETCGNKIEPGTNMIHCQNCGSSFTPSDGSHSKCDYCGSRVQMV